MPFQLYSFSRTLCAAHNVIANKCKNKKKNTLRLAQHIRNFTWSHVNNFVLLDGYFKKTEIIIVLADGAENSVQGYTKMHKNRSTRNE